MTKTPHCDSCGRIPILSNLLAGITFCYPLLVDCLNKFSDLSLCTLSKFVPLWLVTSSGLSLVATQAKRIHEYVVLNENAISKCTALVAEHVNRHKHITADILRVILLLKGPA